MLRTLSSLVAALFIVALAHVAVAAAADPADGAVDSERAAADAGEPDAPELTETEHNTSGNSGGFLSYDESDTHPRRSFASLVLRLVISMAIILGLIYGGFLLVKLLTRTTKAAPKSEKLIRVVDRATLDAKRAIYLVKVVDRLLVVGVGTNEVRTLAEIEDKTVVDTVQDAEFVGHLQSWLGRLAGRTT
jgi:flagellar biogenesis protein FliO